MNGILRVLLVEDREHDAQVTLTELRKTRLEVQSRRVQNAADFRAALESGGWDLVVAKDALPAFSAQEALGILRTLGSDLPLVVLSGTPGEDTAVAAMRAGARDYLLTRHLERLPAVVMRELRETEERRGRREAEQAFGKNQILFQEIVNHIPGIVFRAHHDGGSAMCFDFISGPAEAVFEYPAQRILADSSLVWNLVLPEDTAALDQSIAATRGTTIPWEHEFRIRTPGGSLKWIRGNAVVISAEPQALSTLIGALTDITAHKTTQAAALQNAERFRSIFESVQDVYYETTLDGTILEINQAAAAVFGAGPRELIGHNASALYLQPEDRERMLDELATHSRIKDFEVALKGSEGRVIHAALTAHIIHDHKGTPVRIRGVLRDITERKRLEESRRRLEAQLRQAQKMEAIGTLAGGIAHDFNNMLTAIMGHAELLRLDAGTAPGSVESVDGILKAAHRAKELVQQILTFSRRREQQRVVTRLSPIIKEAIKLLRASLPSTIEMDGEIEEVPNVLADPTQIHQVVMNLCTNAAHAIGNQPGRLQVQLQVETVDQLAASRNRSLLPRRYVVLTVADDGCGMEASTVERIFDPFFTTKPPGEGTGIGLAVVHAIIESHEGAITVESQPGLGTTFRIFLPVIEAETTIIAADRPAVPLGSNEEILVVDDEPPILQIADRMLARMGYRAVCFNRPMDALAEFEKNPDRFALVMTDLTMPKLTGLDLAKRIRRIRAGTPLLLVTGLGGSMTDELARQLGFRMLLAKPFEFVALAKAIATALARS